jgi:hypothetical protein
MPRDFEYEQNNIGYDEQYPNGGIKCKNYVLCKSVLPEWWYDAKGCYICSGCDFNRYGELLISNNLECPICLENKINIKQTQCIHSICIDCFIRIYYGDDCSDSYPEFPYPEIEKDYDDNYWETREHEKWKKYPLIDEWENNLNKWCNDRERKFDEETHLRKCPLCRK